MNDINLKSIIEIWKKDYTFKTITSSVISFGGTILFALYNGFLRISLLSVWHGSICVFYLLLIAIPGMILLNEKRNAIGSENDGGYCGGKTFCHPVNYSFGVEFGINTTYCIDGYI